MFHSARLKLTTWYLLMIMLVSVAFSAGIYRVLVMEVTRFERLQRIRLEQRLQNGDLFPQDIRPRRTPSDLIPNNPELIDDIKHRVLLTLVMINVGVFVAAGGLGYFLAGKTLKPIKEMVENQNQFISDASHELKTPLTALKTSMEVNLRDKNLNLKEAKTLIKESVEDVNKLQVLSEGLLTLVGFQIPNGNSKFAQVSTGQILKDAIRKMKHLASLKNITIKIMDKDYKVSGNADNLTNLFVILLDNAIKYSPKKSKIEIKSMKNDGTVTISFTDHGIGIAAENIPHIFDRFYRSDQSRTKSETNGFGLGLAIAQKIVQNHRGTIEVESKLKTGSTFSVTLPTR